MATMSNPSMYFDFLVSPQIPPELVLQTIQYLPFHRGALISALRNAHPRLCTLFSTYEQSLVRHFMRKELRHAAIDFPCKHAFNIDWLADCVRNYDTIDDILDSLCSQHNSNAVLPHNVSLANAGMLILHRISSLEKHKDKLYYIRSLKRDPLIAVYLVLHHSTLAARFHGSGWINQGTYGRYMGANQIELRSQLEFCFAEAALCIGPNFISDTLLYHDRSNCETTLLNFYHEHGTHEWDWPCWGTGKGEFEPPRTQGPQRNPLDKERTLFIVMLERLAELMQCDLSDVRERVERDLESADHPLAYLDLGGKEQLLEGENLEFADVQKESDGFEEF